MVKSKVFKEDKEMALLRPPNLFKQVLTAVQTQKAGSFPLCFVSKKRDKHFWYFLLLHPFQVFIIISVRVNNICITENNYKLTAAAN